MNTIDRIIGRSRNWTTITDPMYESVTRADDGAPHRSRDGTAAAKAHVQEAQESQEEVDEGTDNTLPLFSPLPPRSPESYDGHFASLKIILPHMRGLTYDDLDGAGRAEVHKRWVEDYQARRPFCGTATPRPPRVFESPPFAQQSPPAWPSSS